MSGKFTVACVQNCAADDLERNLDRAEALTRQAVNEGAGFVCLPEYFCVLESTDRAYFEKGFSEDAHPAVARFRSLAAELEAWVLLGSVPVRASEGKVNNRSLLLDAHGRVVARYDKIHLFDVAIRDGQDYRESAGVIPGDRAVVADLPWGRVGLSVCYDVRFPYLYRTLAQAGAAFLTVPAAFTAKTGEAHWHALLRARAIETGSYVFAPGQCGRRPWGRRTYGHSLIVDPWGRVLADAGEEEGVVTAPVDPEAVVEARRMIPALTHDRAVAPPDP